MSEISLEQFAATAPGAATVIDVRQPREYVDGHVSGSILMPMTELSSRLAELDRTRPVHVICASGNRSGALADFLAGLGFEALSVAGGVTAWAASGRPLVTRVRPTAPAPAAS
ncbi:rhodanese-like domain-containing protein [Knoellia subterranea]|uniref:Sulfurtransferase n=1 Tax=Knoellia subterranea KCTC 19937 TaxID=1385521 RepID=A0A0A0JSK0_9MICO|nr:rhodanese-like domain-containing protein [Knoellia subterranea]KGN39017.1 sulfurtransferase [Knoellia subterranea KCTC 19937]